MSQAKKAILRNGKGQKNKHTINKKYNKKLIIIIIVIIKSIKIKRDRLSS